MTALVMTCAELWRRSKNIRMLFNVISTKFLSDIYFLVLSEIFSHRISQKENIILFRNFKL